MSGGAPTHQQRDPAVLCLSRRNQCNCPGPHLVGRRAAIRQAASRPRRSHRRRRMARSDVGTTSDAAGRCDRARDRTRAEAPSAPAKRSARFSGWIEWLLPRPRLAIATSALATFAIVAVGIDIALHTNPQFRQVIQSQSSPPGGSDAPWQDRRRDCRHRMRGRISHCSRRRRNSGIRSCSPPKPSMR